MLRHGGRHDIKHNLKNGVSQPVPRHRDVKELLAKKIIRDLTRDDEKNSRPVNHWPFGVSMNTYPTFRRSGTGPAGRRAGRLPSLPIFAAAALWLAAGMPECLGAESKDIGGLISWLLEDGRDLRAIPFPDVLAATTGKKIIPIEPEADRPWLDRLGRVLDKVLADLNSPSQGIHKAGRINEASRFIEDQLRSELNREAGWKCMVPSTAAGEEQRSGYPDLRLVLENGDVVYLDPKLFETDSRNSTLRTFYYEPKTTTNKVHDNARHLLVAIRHNGKTGADLRLLGWELVDVSRICVRLKAEFQASNHDMYQKDNIVAESPQKP